MINPLSPNLLLNTIILLLGVRLQLLLLDRNLGVQLIFGFAFNGEDGLRELVGCSVTADGIGFAIGAGIGFVIGDVAISIVVGSWFRGVGAQELGLGGARFLRGSSFGIFCVVGFSGGWLGGFGSLRCLSAFPGR